MRPGGTAGLMRYPALAMLQERLMAFLPPSSLRRRLAGGSFWLILGSAAAQFLGLLLAVAVTRLLGLGDYGRLGVVLATLELFVSLTTAGLWVAFSRRIAASRRGDPTLTGRLVGISILLAGLSGAASAALLAALAGPIAAGFLRAPELAPILRIGALYVFCSALHSGQTAALAGLEAFPAFARAAFVRAAVLLPAGAAGAYLSGVEGVVAGYAAAAAAACGAGRLLVARECALRGVTVDHRPRRDIVGEMALSGLPVFFAGYSMIAVSWWAHAYLALRAGFEESGLFAAALKWQLVILFFSNALSSLGVPLLASVAEEKDVLRFRRAFRAYLALQSLSTAAVALPVVLVPGMAMSVFGGDYARGGGALAMVAASSVLSALNLATGQALWALSRLRAGAAFALIRALLLGGSAYLLAPAGALGLGTAHLLAQGALAVSQWPYAAALVRRTTAAWPPTAERETPVGQSMEKSIFS
jgi:O-antigen/teichoic acid export membrane protein